MHMSRLLHVEDFEVAVDGGAGTFDDLFADFTMQDRVAVVTHSPGGSLSAAPALLAAVARYYADLRRTRDDFYRYPAYFVLHVGGLQAYHGWLDVWAEHKEVVVAPHAETILEALHDRGVTRVLLESRPPGTGELMRETVNWFCEDVRDVLAFTPGQDTGALTVRSSETAARFVRQAVEASVGLVPDDVARTIVAGAERPQAFERLAAEQGLALLCGYGAAPGVLGQSEAYLGRHGADAVAMARHRHVVG